jgi:hypothetical protein
MKRTITIATLALLLAACSGTAGTLPTTDTGGGLTLGAGAPVLDLSDPAAFLEVPGNYEITMVFEFIGTRADGSAVAGQVNVEGVNQAEPPASSYTFTATGDVQMAQGGTFQAVTIGDQSYFSSSQTGCISMALNPTDTPFDNLVDSGGMIQGEAQRVMPDETINGVPAYHYALTQDNIDLADAAAMDIDEVTSGAIYVAKDGGYVERIVLEGRGASEVLSGDAELVGDIDYQLDLTPVASVGAIEVPAGCEAAEVSQQQYPVMADATAVASFEGFLSYQSPSSLETILEFYRVQMPAAGWVLDEESQLANIGLLRYTQGDRIVSVVVTFDANTNISNVIVGEEE